MRQGISKDSMAFIFCGPSIAGHAALPFRGVCFHSETPIEKAKSSFASDHQLEIAIGLGNRGLCPLLLSVLGPHLMKAWAGPAHAASASVSLYAH